MSHIAFAVAISTTLLITAVPAAADPVAIHKIGVLMPPVATKSIEDGVRQGLRELGYVEGQNLVIEWRQSAGTDEALRKLAVELVRAGAELLVTPGSPATQAALQATTVPVVFEVGDPVAAGFAASLARPGGRATGVSALATELYPKRMELLLQLVPRARRIAYLRNPSNPMAPFLLEEMRTAARRLGVQLEPLGARDGPQVEAALRSLQRNPPDGLIISAELNFLEKKEEIAGSIRKAKLPTIFPWREYHDAGAIVSYGASLTDLMRRMGRYIDLILKGANPGELPVEQISKYELVVDMRVARSERIDIPESFLVLADEVIR